MAQAPHLTVIFHGKIRHLSGGRGQRDGLADAQMGCYPYTLTFVIHELGNARYNGVMQLPDIIDRVRPSVVQIRRSNANQPSVGQTIGSGFIVSDTAHVATALHVVEAVDLSAGESIHVAFAAPNIDTPTLKMQANFSEYEGQVIGTDKDQDLALIHVPQLAGPGLRVQLGPEMLEAKPVAARLNTSSLREGVELAVSGYPLAEASLVTNIGILASTFTQTDNPSQICYLGDFTANRGIAVAPCIPLVTVL